MSAFLLILAVIAVGALFALLSFAGFFRGNP